ncbi:MAG: hypothetical protein RLZZ501_2162 [Pseudomonadota bacterium]|jgi:hypothetical protein
MARRPVFTPPPPAGPPVPAGGQAAQPFLAPRGMAPPPTRYGPSAAVQPARSVPGSFAPPPTRYGPAGQGVMQKMDIDSLPASQQMVVDEAGDLRSQHGHRPYETKVRGALGESEATISLGLTGKYKIVMNLNPLFGENFPGADILAVTTAGKVVLVQSKMFANLDSLYSVIENESSILGFLTFLSTRTRTGALRKQVREFQEFIAKRCADGTIVDPTFTQAVSALIARDEEDEIDTGDPNAAEIKKRFLFTVPAGTEVPRRHLPVVFKTKHTPSQFQDMMKTVDYTPCKPRKRFGEKTGEESDEDY